MLWGTDYKPGAGQHADPPWDIVTGVSVGAIIVGLIAPALFLVLTGAIGFVYGLWLLAQERRCVSCHSSHHVSALLNGLCRRCRRPIRRGRKTT